MHSHYMSGSNLTSYTSKQTKNPFFVCGTHFPVWGTDNKSVT